MERRSPRQRKLSSSTPKKSNYYAGARFETIPTMSSLPAPPMRWTMSSPLLRSQSMPSSPITTNMMWMGMGSGSEERRLASTPVSSTIFKSASFPGDSSLLSLFRVRESSNAQEEQITEIRPPSPEKVEEKVDLIQMLIQASPKKEEQEKKKEQTPVKLIPRSIARQSCQFANGQEYKDITNHLKSLLKVSA